jgi:hypothetical protein
MADNSHPLEDISASQPLQNTKNPSNPSSSAHATDNTTTTYDPFQYPAGPCPSAPQFDPNYSNYGDGDGDGTLSESFNLDMLDGERASGGEQESGVEHGS